MLLITIKGYRVALPLYFDLKKTALQLEVFMMLLIVMHVNLVSNTCIHVPSNLTECSTIQGGIGVVISKLDEHVAQGWFEIMSTIIMTTWIIWHEVQLLTNCINNKMLKLKMKAFEKFFWVKKWVAPSIIVGNYY